MNWRRRLVIPFLLLLPFADACSELKRMAYDDLGRRDEWQHPERVVDALGLAPGQTIADLGAGGGYFTFRLAEAVAPDGRVYAVDVDEGMLARIDEAAQEQGLTNVTTLVAAAEDPGLPEAVDLVFVSNTYHHLSNRVQYFERVRGQLKPDGRVAVLEFGLDHGLFQSCGHGTRGEQIRSEMEAAGYTLTGQFDFTARQTFQIFEVVAK